MVLLHHGGEFFGRRQIGPTLKQFAFAAQNQNLKRSRADWNPKLRRNAPIEIRDSEDVASRIVRDIFGGVTGLKPFRFRVQAASDQCIHDRPHGCVVLFLKAQVRDHPEFGVAQTIFRNAIAHGSRLSASADDATTIMVT